MSIYHSLYKKEYELSKEAYHRAERRYSTLWDIPVPESTYVPHVLAFYSREEGTENEETYDYEEYNVKICENVHSMFDTCERISIEEEELDEDWYYRCTLMWVRFI